LVPRLNILAGTRLVAVLLRHYQGDVVSALLAYNARPRPIFAPLPENGETELYVRAVLEAWTRFQRCERGRGRRGLGRRAAPAAKDWLLRVSNWNVAAGAEKHEARQQARAELNPRGGDGRAARQSPPGARRSGLGFVAVGSAPVRDSGTPGPPVRPAGRGLASNRRGAPRFHSALTG